MPPAERRIGEAAVVIPGAVSSDVLLLCDHASNVIPPEYNDLGVGAPLR